MSTTPEPQKKELSSTYFVQDRSNQNELMRVMLQDQLITTGMGGVLPEQDPQRLQQVKRILDVGCGTGYWLVEAAKDYPHVTTLVGVDISKTMIDYARNRAEEQQVGEHVEFRVMDATRMLEFSADSFDLVNLRFGSSFLRTWDWLKMIHAFMHVTRRHGIIRVTEPDILECSSPSLTILLNLLIRAFYQAGNTFAPEITGITGELVHLLTQSGLKQVQSKPYVMHYQAGTPECQILYEDMRHSFHNLRPFLGKWTHLPDNYEAIYQQALQEMQQPGFTAKWAFLTTWGIK